LIVPVTLPEIPALPKPQVSAIAIHSSALAEAKEC
jgi:hypothetical protein